MLFSLFFIFYWKCDVLWKLIKFGFIVSIMILVLWVLGLVCDVVVVKFMGDGVVVDVFFFVNKIFNFFCCLFVEGVFV